MAVERVPLSPGNHRGKVYLVFSQASLTGMRRRNDLRTSRKRPSEEEERTAKQTFR